MNDKSNDSLTEFLAKVEFLSAFTEAERANLAERAEVRYFDMGDNLATTGDLANHLLIVKKGSVRLFADEDGKMNRSVTDIGGGVLVISQFTLYADTRKGNRPSFIGAAPPVLAERLYELYVEALRAELGRDRVATGVFGAMMSVEIVNDGPVTIELTTDGKDVKA